MVCYCLYLFFIPFDKILSQFFLDLFFGFANHLPSTSSAPHKIETWSDSGLLTLALSVYKFMSLASKASSSSLGLVYGCL